MDVFLPIVMLVVGIACGAAGAWLVLRARIEQAAERARGEAEVERATLAERLAAREQAIGELKVVAAQTESKAVDLQQQQSKLTQEKVQLATMLTKEREQAAEKLALLNEAEQKLKDAFKALAAEALASNNQSFMNLAETKLKTFEETAKGDLEKRQLAIDKMVEPMKVSLDKVDAKIQALETAREGAYSRLNQQLVSLVETEKQLRGETANLVKALRAPQVRGRWGEIQLKRVVELAGMLDHCDFHEQVSETTEEGRLRPDMVVHLPGGIDIVVDAKVPLEAYLGAIEAADDETRDQKLKDHARQVQSHIASLSKKKYWDQFPVAPDFVIMFLPGESLYDAAQRQEPTLIESAVNQRVMIATPMSLITLLRAVAVGWRQQAIARNAQEISELGKDLYKRLATLGEHLITMGRSLDRAVTAYNDSIGALERNVLTSARRFRDLETTDSGKEIPDLIPVDQTTRKLQKVEFLPAPEAAAAALAREEGALTAADRADRDEASDR